MKTSDFWKIIELLPILVITVILRNAYLDSGPKIVVEADTYSYYIVGQRMLQEGFWRYFVNDNRTPIYPLLLQLPQAASGIVGEKILSNSFYESMWQVVKLQYLAGIVGIVIFYETLLYLKIKKIFAWVLTLFIGCNIFVFCWDKILMTESLAILFIIGLLFFVSRLLVTLRGRYIWIVSLILAFGFLLRPIYVALPFVILPFIPLYHRTKRSLRAAIAVLALYLLVPSWYLVHNAAVHQYYGINRISDTNVLGKILYYNLPIEKAKEFTAFYNDITQSRKNQGDPMPYRFLDHVPSTTPYLEGNLLGQFNRKVIIGNSWEYLSKSTAQILPAMVDTGPFTMRSMGPRSSANEFLYKLVDIYHAFQYLTWIILPAFGLTVIMLVKKPSFKLAWLGLAGAISVYQIISSVFLSYDGEYGRLIMVAQPAMYFFTFYWLGSLCKLCLHRPH
jgi:hypothetical protein